MILDFTEAKIANLPMESGIHRDRRVRGLMVKCNKRSKTYACQGDVRRGGRLHRTVRVTIGRVGEVSLAEARNRAAALMSEIKSGIDPTEERRASRDGITLREAFEAHLRERDLAPRTVEDYEYTTRKYLAKLMDRTVAGIARDECRQLLATIERASGSTTAAGVGRVLRALCRTAMAHDDNLMRSPMDGVRLKTAPRRTVGPLDARTFFDATEQQPPLYRDLYRFVLLTGARRASALPILRDEVDLQRRTVTFSHVKTFREGLTLPIGPWLAAVLERRMNDDGPSPYLWPSPARASHVYELRRREGIPAPHELRKHCRNLLVEAGAPFVEANMLLQQRTPGVSFRYLSEHALVEHLRPWAEKLESLVLERSMISLGLSFGARSSSQTMT